MLDFNELLHTPAVNGLWPVKGSRFVLQVWPSDVDPASVIVDAVH